MKHYHQPEGLEVSLSYTQFDWSTVISLRDWRYHSVTHSLYCHQPEGLEVSLSYTQFVLSSARGTGGITQLHTCCIEALSSAWGTGGITQLYTVCIEALSSAWGTGGITQLYTVCIVISSRGWRYHSVTHSLYWSTIIRRYKLITHNCSDSDPHTEGVEVCHTYSHIVSHCFCVVTVKPFPHRPGHMQSFHVQVGADKVTSLLMWRPSDHGSCCELLSVDQVWRRSDDSTRSWRRCCQLVEFSGDYSTHTLPFNGPFSWTTRASQYQKNTEVLKWRLQHSWNK